MCLSEKAKRPLETDEGWTENYQICRLIDAHFLTGMAKMRKFPTRQVTLEKAARFVSFGYCSSPKNWGSVLVRELHERTATTSEAPDTKGRNKQE